MEARESRVVVVDRVDQGLHAAAGDPRVVVVVFARNWCEVDQARAAIRASGLESRLRVHHTLARHWAKVA